MPNFKVFGNSDIDLTSSQRTQFIKTQTVYCNVQNNVRNGSWRNTNDIIVAKNNDEKNEIINVKNYELLNILHKGFYSYKQDISGYCFENGTTINTNNKYQLFDILYNGYTYTDIENVDFDINNLCNITDYYSMVQLDLSYNNFRPPNKYQRIYKFPTKLVLE